MINAGVPETVAEDNAKALSLFAEGDPITSPTTCPRSSADRRVRSNSSPPTTLPHFPSGYG